MGTILLSRGPVFTFTTVTSCPQSRLLTGELGNEGEPLKEYISFQARRSSTTKSHTAIKDSSKGFDYKTCDISLTVSSSSSPLILPKASTAAPSRITVDHHRNLQRLGHTRWRSLRKDFSKVNRWACLHCTPRVHNKAAQWDVCRHRQRQ